MTGPSPESRSIMEEVKKNHAALNGCVGPHDFQPTKVSSPIFRDYKCSKCGGTIDGAKKHWYDMGLKHGRQST